MIVNVNKFTWQRVLAEAMLAALSARPAAALLTTPTLVLRTDVVDLTPDNVFADITLADFSGYAEQAVTPSAPVHESASAGGVLLNGVWIATTATPFVDNVIRGFALTDGGTTLYGGCQFDTPVPIAAPGDFLDLTVLAGLEFMWNQ